MLLANAIAPEHLELLTEDADLLAGAVATAGCVFIGERGATAFGDYAAGSNHVLPTGGAGRFQGPLGPDAFRRRISTVEMTQDGGPGAGSDGRYIGPRRGLPAARRVREARRKGLGACRAPLRSAARPGRPRSRSRLDLDGGEAKSRPGSASSTTCWSCSARHGRLGLRAARRPGTSRPAPTTRSRTSASPRPGDRRGARRPRRDPPLRLRARADGRGARRVRRSTSPGGRSVAFDADLPDGDDRGLRRGADRGVLPGGLQQLEDDAAPLGSATARTPTT